jgi:ABC-type polysaccharide/polyol phosphate export permease
MSIARGFSLALEDFAGGIKLAPLWWRVGLEQTVTRYRRTILGPFWLASSTLATGVSLAIVFGSIFGGDVRTNFPFIMAGVVCWAIVGGMLVEGSNTFINGAGVMQVQKLPISFHAFLQVDRMFINFLHQIVAYWVVLLILRLAAIPHWQIIFALPLIFATALAMAVPVGMLCVRFRDINFMVGFVSQAMFMLTPVFWRRGQMAPKLHWLVDLNPFAHLLEVIRQPLLGHPAPMSDWIASLGFFGATCVVALISMTLFRRRVIFWL